MTTEIAGSVIIESGELFLLYRSDKENQEGWWEVPGGKVEEDESPTAAAVREAREEVGIDVELEKPFFSGEFEHSGEIYLWHGYLASTDEEPEIQEEKFGQKNWFSAEELDELDGEQLAPNLRQILPALRKVLKAAEEGN